MKALKFSVLCLIAAMLLAAPAQAKELSFYTDHIEKLMTRERVKNMMDVTKKLKESGASYQQSLTFPLDPKIDFDDDAIEDMRILIGVYQFDALYAAAFGKKKEVAEFLKAQNTQLLKLNLKGQMDVSAVFPPEIKWMMREPDNVDFDDIVAAYADNAAKYKELTKDPAGFDVIEGVLYGFTLECLYVTGKSLLEASDDPQMAKVISGMVPSLDALVILYGMFEDSGDYAKYVDPDMFLESGERMGWLKPVLDLIRAEGGALSKKELAAITRFASKEREEIAPYNN